MKIKLPIKDNYSDFIKRNKGKKVEGVYKLTFVDGEFYIGTTSNFIGRIYNHSTMTDLNKGCKMTRKHERMLKAINNRESLVFEIISHNPDDERTIIKKHINESGCLNMKI